MSEFGHFGKVIPGFGCIDSWGAGPFEIIVGAKRFRFEDSDRFGPTLIKRDGSEISNQPTERHPFWRGYDPWRAQGRQLADDGVTCIWCEPKPTTVMKLHGRQHLTIEDGEDGGQVIVLPFDPDHPKVKALAAQTKKEGGEK